MIDTILGQLKPWQGRKIVAAMSGGVDSSLAAALLHLAGAQVHGVHMRMRCHGASELACKTPVDIEDAARVGGQFGFPFEALDFEAGFREEVIEPFIRDYMSGRTPNPCVLCNDRLKLGRLLQWAGQLGADRVATGHYGQIIFNPATGRSELHSGVDPLKDQSYYLAMLAQAQLSRMLMPIGALTKAATRELARELALPIHDKSESMDLCFVPDGDYRRFVRENTQLDEDSLAGRIVDVDGRELGRHRGIHYYTVGQRHGLGLAAPRPLYVVALWPETREVVVGFAEELLADALVVDGLNWVGMAPRSEPFRARVKIRYRSPGERATVHPDPSGNGRARVVFDEPVRAITPGQLAVAYGEKSATCVLAAGWIQGRG